MNINHFHNRSGDLHAMVFEVVNCQLPVVRPGCCTTRLLLVMMFFFIGLMSNSYAQDVSLASKPPVDWTKTKLTVADRGVDAGSINFNSIEELADEVDIEDIRFGPPDCTYRDPIITISPSDVQWAYPGTPIEYTVIVTNTSSTSCDPAKFDLSLSAPTGWDVELKSRSLYIAPDWSTATLGMVITSPSQEQANTYDIRLSANNRLLSIGSSATVRYVVETDKPVSACSARKPLINIQPIKKSGRIGDISDYNIFVTNQDNSFCKESNFIIKYKSPDGLESSLTSSSLHLPPAETGIITLSVQNRGSAAPGIHHVEVNISDPQETIHVASAVAELIIEQTCTPITPSLILGEGASVSGIDTTYTYSFSLINNDPASCTASTYDLTITFLPEGWRGSLSTRQLILPSGKSRKATLAVTPPPGAPSGTYKLQVGVSDALHLEHAITETISQIVNNAIPASGSINNQSITDPG